MTNHILLLGAHGNISRMMIPLFLAKNWSVTALIRDPKQEKTILDLRHDETMTKDPKTGKLDVLVQSLEDIKTSQEAASVIDKVKGVNWIVWFAGAGSGGENESREVKNARTNAIDRDAAVAFAHAATHNSQIERYLTISAINSRRHVASWWKEQAKAMKEAGDSIKTYTIAKTVADECLTTWAEERRAKDEAFKYIVLRPGALVGTEARKEGEERGKIQLGRTTGGKSIHRMDVALTAVELLDKGANGWFDLMEGPDKIGDAVGEVIKKGEEGTSLERKDLKDMRETADLAFGGKDWETYCSTFEANRLPQKN